MYLDLYDTYVIYYLQGTRQLSSIKETRVNIFLRMPLERREEKMQGDEFHAFLLLDIFLLFICFSSDRCVASGSGKIEKGYDAAKERIDKYWRNKIHPFQRGNTSRLNT